MMAIYKKGESVEKDLINAIQLVNRTLNYIHSTDFVIGVVADEIAYLKQDLCAIHDALEKGDYEDDKDT